MAVGDLGNINITGYDDVGSFGDMVDTSFVTDMFSGPAQDPTAGLNLSGGMNWGAIGTGLQVAGSIGSAIGTMQAGAQTRAADENNAALVAEQGVLEQYQLDKSEVALQSTQQAMFAKAGVTMTGSPLDAMLQSSANFELDKQISKYNTQSKVDMLNWEGKMAQKNANQQAGMDLLKGAATFALML